MGKGGLNVFLGLNIRDFQKNLRKAQRSLQRAATNFQSYGRDLTQSVSLPIAGLGGTALKASADIEQLRNALNSITGDTKETEKQLTRVRKIAEAPGIGFEQAIKATLQLQGLGVEARAAEETIKQVANVVAASGGGQDAFEGAVKQLNQIQAKNRVLQEDINILLENVPALGKVLQDTFGAKTAEGIRATGVTGQEFFAKLVIGLQDLERVQGGLKNSFENFGVAIRFALADLGDEIDKAFDVRGTLDKLSQTIQNVTAAFKELSPEQKKAILQFAAIAAAVGPVLIVVGKLISVSRFAVVALSSLLKPLAATGKAFAYIRGAVVAAGGGIKGLAIALRALVAPMLIVIAKVLAIVAAFAAIVGAYLYIRRNSEAFKVFFLNVWTSLKIGITRRINGLIGAIQPIFKSLGIEINKLNEPFDKLLDQPGFESFKQFTEGVKKDVQELAPGLFNAVSGIKKLKENLTGGSSSASGLSETTDQPGVSDQELLNAFGGSGAVEQTEKLTKAEKKRANVLTEMRNKFRAIINDNTLLIDRHAKLIKLPPYDPKLEAANQLLRDTALELANVQIQADALGVQDSAEQFDLLASKINLVKKALQEAAVQFGTNSDVVASLRETLAPLEEEYNKIQSKQEQMRDTLNAVNTAFAEGASAAEESSEQQQNAFAAAGQAALAAAAKVIKAELQKAVATQIAKILSSVPAPFNLILAAGAGAAVGALFQRAVSSIGIPGLAKGGIVPPGFPNDTFLARLSSNEAVIPLDRLGNMLGAPQQVFIAESTIRGEDIVTSYTLAKNSIER